MTARSSARSGERRAPYWSAMCPEPVRGCGTPPDKYGGLTLATRGGLTLDTVRGGLAT